MADGATGQPASRVRRRRQVRSQERADGLVSCNVLTPPERRAQIDKWAEEHGYSRSGAGNALLGHALAFAERDGFVTLPEMNAGIDQLRAAVTNLEAQNLRLQALVCAGFELSAMAPLMLTHWMSTELGAQAIDETPEQAEERAWQLWRSVAEVEWEARRRKVAPTDEELALECGEEEEGGAEEGEAVVGVGDGNLPAPGGAAPDAVDDMDGDDADPGGETVDDDAAFGF